MDNDRDRHILLINADHAVLHLTKMKLEDEQYSVYHAGSGAEAERIYREHRWSIALVICDANVLQHHDRLCLVRIQEARPDVQIILCANAEEMTHFEEYVQFHDIVFILKPYTSETVIEFAQSFFSYRANHHIS